MATTSTTQEADLPSWAAPYVTSLLKSAGDIAAQPYQPYGGQRIAGLNKEQLDANKEIAGLGVAPELDQASGIAALIGKQAGTIGSYTPMSYKGLDTSYLTAQAPNLQQYQMGPAQQVAAQDYTGQNVQQYMSPYMQNVVEQQKRGAVQDYARQIPGLQAATARAGARGGTRDALLRAEAQRNLNQQLQGIQSTGSQQAFQNAQQQFNAQQQANMQAQLANQQAGLTTGQQNLAAQLGVQQLGAQTGLQAQLANQQAQLQEQQQRLAQSQAAQAAEEQSRQFGSNLGMQGLQQGLGAAQVLGGLGQQRFGQQQQGIQMRQAAGAQMQNLEQQRLENMYQDFLAQRNYPQQQASFMGSILRGGTPTQQNTQQSTYTPAPSPLSSLLGNITSGYSLYKLFGG